MFIKYLNNIYNINSHYSIVKGVGFNIVKPSINLFKDDSNFTSLEFENKDMRDYIINRIWEELKKHTDCFDIDEELNIYLNIKKYNM